MKKQAAPYFTWGNNEGSYWNTINPLSGLFGGGDRIPGWWMRMFNTKTQGEKIRAALAFKTVACSVLAAGLVGGYRAIKHFNRISEMAESDNPVSNLSSQLSTTFEGTLNPQKGKQQPTKEELPKTAAAKDDKRWVNMPPLSWQNLVGMSLPLGASLLAAGLAYGAVDDWAAARRNRKLDAAIKSKDNAVKSLMQTRARIAKGNITESDVNKTISALKDDDLYIKEAKKDSDRSYTEAIGQSAISTYGLMASMLLLASAVGSYRYFSEADPNNIKYKVSKRSLRDYARSKTSMSPVTVVPTDQKAFFKAIDKPGKAPAQQVAREMPELDTTSTGKPVTITL